MSGLVDLGREFDADAVAWRRFWAALMLARDIQTVEAILAGQRVPRRRLDRRALRRAYRGAGVPSDEWILITVEMLDAVELAGPFR